MAVRYIGLWRGARYRDHKCFTSILKFLNLKIIFYWYFITHLWNALFCIEQSFFKGLVLKFNETHRNCLFSLFSVLWLVKCKELTKTYLISTFLQIILQFYYGLWCKHSHENFLFAQNDGVSSKKDIFYKIFSLKPCSLRIKNLHRKLKYQKSKNMGLWQKLI